MRTTSTINFYCRPSKVDKNGFAPIEVSIIINSKRCFFNLPRKENPTVFKKELKRRNSDLNCFLNSARDNINGIQTELSLRKIPITIATMKEYIKSGGIKTFTVKDMFDEYFSILENRIGIDLTDRTYAKYIIVRNEFETYFGKEREAETISSIDIQHYYDDLKSKFKLSTTSGKMRKLKTIFRFAFENSLISTFPFNQIRIVKEKPNIDFLTISELNRIKDTPMPTERLQKASDLFVFQACSGLSYADMINLSGEDIKSSEGLYFIHKRRVKTGVEFTSVILPEGIGILKKYKYRLPSLCNQNYNVLLKLVSEVCGLDRRLYSHLGRKTYATRLLNEGVPITSVSKALGHSEIKTTTRYYAKTFDSTVINDISKHFK